VFGSSRPQESDEEYADARELGQLLADRGFALCTGGYGGVMEAVSRGAKEVGGKVYGVTAEFFARKANEWVDVEVRMKTWEERLFELIRLADGFVGWNGNAGGVGSGVGNVEQGRDAGEAVYCPGRFLDADTGAGAGSGAGTEAVDRGAEVGRGEGEFGAYGGDAGRCGAVFSEGI
jgi:uncharacterized protein (TIGR00725 family)